VRLLHGAARRAPGDHLPGASFLAGAVAGAAVRRLRPAPRPGHHRRQPAPAHPLRLLPGRDHACNKREPGTGCTGCAATAERFRAAAEAELAAARPLPGNEFKLPMARNNLVAVLRDLAGNARAG
jgi:hypothetical protein